MKADDYWLALYTQPHKEYLVRSLLQEKGLEVYLPEEPNRIQRRDRPPSRPFFPHYLFLQKPVDETSYDDIQWTPGLRRIVGFGGRPALIPSSLIELIREELIVRETEKDSPFEQGQLVCITSGPFKGIEAIFDRRLSGSERVRVFLDIIGRAQVSMDIHMGDLCASDP